MADMGNVLVMDTCGEGGYVAVVSTVDRAALSERHLQNRATQEQLLPAIREALTEAAVPLASLCSVAVVRGPGSFTGVRIGLAAAKGLCEAASLPLLTLSRLVVLAHAVEPKPAWSWLQAGRGEVYAAQVHPESEAGPESPASEGVVWSLPEAIAAAGAGRIAVCEESLRNATPRCLWADASAFERALRESAVIAAREERWSDVALSDALYLRVPDAELARKAKQG